MLRKGASVPEVLLMSATELVQGCAVGWRGSEHWRGFRDPLMFYLRSLAMGRTHDMFNFHPSFISQMRRDVHDHDSLIVEGGDGRQYK
jgi:hypothetical protein